MNMSAPHLHDDDLSAALDGFELSPDDAAHLAACERCRARLDALAAAANALTAPVPVPAGLRDAAVARALDAGDEPVAGGRSRRPPAWLGAVAAAVVVILGVSVATRMGDGGDDAGTAASNALDGGDLGVLDAADLRTRVQAVLEPPAVADSDAGGGTGGGQMESSGPTDGGDASVDGAPAMALRQTNGGERTPSTAACEVIVLERYDRGLAGPLVYRATGTWEGKDAFVLAYRIADAKGQLDHLVYVVARRDCELLNVQTF